MCSAGSARCRRGGDTRHVARPAWTTDAGRPWQLAEHRSAPAARDDLHRWSTLVERRGACHHPDGTVRFLRSTLTVFADEVMLHETGRCSAGTYEPFLPIPASSPDHKDDWS